jgi:radical SAM protein with 4Fe4S-binding SPASM domain
MQDSHIVTTVYTNMSLMTPEKAKEILEAGVIDNLEVSFYAPTKEIYEKLQPPLKYMSVSENIKSFMLLKRKLGYTKPKVNLHYIAMPQLYDGAKAFMDKWRPIVDSIGFVHYDNWHGDKPSLENDDYWPINPEKERYPCPRIWNGMQILSNGEVVPCCLDYECLQPMGNVSVWGLKEIWNDTPFQRFRKLHVERRFDEIPLCRDCTLWRYQHPPQWNLFWRQTKIPLEVTAK